MKAQGHNRCPWYVHPLKFTPSCLSGSSPGLSCNTPRPDHTCHANAGLVKPEIPGPSQETTMDTQSCSGFLVPISLKHSLKIMPVRYLEVQPGC